MFKISENVRRLSDKEKLQYENDGYITGLPVFSDDAQEDLNNLFISLSSRLDDSIDLNQTNMWHSLFNVKSIVEHPHLIVCY